MYDKTLDAKIWTKKNKCKDVRKEVFNNKMEELGIEDKKKLGQCSTSMRIFDLRDPEEKKLKAQWSLSADGLKKVKAEYIAWYNAEVVPVKQAEQAAKEKEEATN